MIDLHYCGTPNGLKVAIMLEETDTPYRVIKYDIFNGEHLTPEFGRINPNQKIPAIVDHDPDFDGGPINVFESGAILQYLAEKTGRFLALSGRSRWQTVSWLIWQVASMGPMIGQASHFLRYAPEGQEYGIHRYTKEMERLLAILEKRLTEVQYVSGTDYTIADIAIWPFLFGASAVMGLKMDTYPATVRWLEAIRTRSKVDYALNKAELAVPAKYMNRTQRLSEDEWSNMFGDKMHQAVRN